MRERFAGKAFYREGALLRIAYCWLAATLIAASTAGRCALPDPLKKQKPGPFDPGFQIATLGAT